MARTPLSRRDFLRVSAVGGSLLVGVRLGASKPPATKQAARPPVDPGALVRIDPDSTVTITIIKSEMGQGVRTSLAMLLAEELDADWSGVKVEQASFDPRFDMGTGGSGSVIEGWATMRRAGAAMRAMLVTEAAEGWGVPAGECTTDASQVIHAASGRRAAYGALAAGAARRPVPAAMVYKPRSAWRIAGKPRRGIDAPDIVHGKAVYGLDVKVPGMLYASVERTLVFGGTVKSFDATAALKVPGVRHVVQLPAIADGVGTHPGIAVVGDNTWAAMTGRRALTVAWEPGPHASENTAAYRVAMRTALGSPGKQVVNKLGDPEAILGRGGKVVSAYYEAPFLSHATMEPQNCTASVTGDKVEIWSPTQFPDWATQAVSQALKVPIQNVKTHVTLLGGGFGRRINPDFTVEAALLSQKIQKPVKVVWSREDDMRHDYYRPCALHRIDASLGSDGLPEAWRHRMVTPAISASGNSSPRQDYGGDEGNGAGDMSYRIPNRSLEYTLLPSGVPRGWWRAVHTTHTVFAVESMIDELAALAGKDPVEYRLTLIDRIPVKDPPTDPNYPFDPERLKGVVRLAAEKSGWGKPLPAGRGRGIACSIDHLGYAAEVVEASVVGKKIRVHRVIVAADSGPIINPDGARAQMEGGVIQALSAALGERITIAGGAVEQRNFDGYRVLRIGDAPAVIEAHFIETDIAPTGLGEPAVPPLAPALANAIAKATGKRLRVLPLAVV